MHHESIKQEILKHLDGLNELERKAGMHKMIEVLAERFNTSEEIIIMAIAEWEAGKGGK